MVEQLRESIMQDKLFERTLENKCPICNKSLDGEVVLVDYKEAKLKVHKEHIKYKIKE